MKTKSLVIALALLAVAGCSFGGWQYVQARQTQSQISTLQSQYAQESAVQSFKVQYASVLDKLTIQGTDSAEAQLIYWTENVTNPGKVLLHASALIGGVFVELPQTRDVTDLVSK